MKNNRTYALCWSCEDCYDIDGINDDIYPGYCSYSCEEDLDRGSCYCNATSHPPCGYCEGPIDAEIDILGGINDIFLWSIWLEISHQKNMASVQEKNILVKK